MRKKKYYKGEDFWEYLEYLSKNENLVFCGKTASLYHGYCRLLKRPIEVYVEEFSNFLEHENIGIQQIIVDSLKTVPVVQFNNVSVVSEERLLIDTLSNFENKKITRYERHEIFDDYFQYHGSFENVEKLVPSNLYDSFREVCSNVISYDSY